MDKPFTLGRTTDGRDIDFELVLEKLCGEVGAVDRLANSLLEKHPEWQEIVEQASRLYSRDLQHLEATTESFETAKQMNFPLEDVNLANAAAILILLGLSHYLHWNGFDIDNPTDFKEISAKLAPARNSIALMSFRMILGWGKTQAEAPSNWLDRLYRESFLRGLTLGYLIADVHSQSPTLSAEFLPKA